MSGESGRGIGHSYHAAVGAAAVAGALATITMDAAMVAAAVVAPDAFSSERLDPEIIGRWAAGLLRGRCRHADIACEDPVRGELLLGLATHYATGIILTGAFLLFSGRHGRALALAVAYGVATSVLPLFVLFPSLGYGPCGVRSGEAGRMVRAMLVGHLAFGAGIGIWGHRLAGRQEPEVRRGYLARARELGTHIAEA